MPLARYFLFVGGVLLALLFVADACLPKMPVADSASGGFDPATIRIHSDRKWPERVVFDTSHPAMVPAQMIPTRIANAELGRPTPAATVDISTTARVRNSFAQLQPSDQEQAQPAAPKKPEKKLQAKRRIAKRHVAPPMMLVAQQPAFGFFGNITR
jgi:hypothetical protein